MMQYLNESNVVKWHNFPQYVRKYNNLLATAASAYNNS